MVRILSISESKSFSDVSKKALLLRVVALNQNEESERALRGLVFGKSHCRDAIFCGFGIESGFVLLIFLPSSYHISLLFVFLLIRSLPFKGRFISTAKTYKIIFFLFPLPMRSSYPPLNEIFLGFLDCLFFGNIVVLTPARE